jgi:hypothetical protein
MPRQNERTPLSHAAQYCHADVVKSLLNAGAKWDLQADSEKGGLFPLHYAAARGGVAAVRLLLKATGATVDVRDEVRMRTFSVLFSALMVIRDRFLISPNLAGFEHGAAPRGVRRPRGGGCSVAGRGRGGGRVVRGAHRSAARGGEPRPRGRRAPAAAARRQDRAARKRAQGTN